MMVLVTGGRNYADRQSVFEALDRLDAELNITALLHGAARGADSLAGKWAHDSGVQEILCPANWDIYSSRAGFLRNSAMADLKPDLVFAFPGGVGTSMMVEIAKERGIPVRYAVDY